MNKNVLLRSKKRILKKAQDEGLEKVLEYYGESLPQSDAAQEDTGAVSLSMTDKEAKELFRYSRRQTGISINEFKGISAGKDGLSILFCCLHHFS